VTKRERPLYALRPRRGERCRNLLGDDHDHFRDCRWRGTPIWRQGRAEDADPMSEGECVAEDSRIAVADERLISNVRYHLGTTIVSAGSSAG
jgi:hypothetical protein